MGHRRFVGLALLFAGTASCASNSNARKPPSATPETGATAPGVATAPPAAPAPANQPMLAGGPPRNGPPGGPPGGFQRRTPLTPEQNAARRDTLDAMRAEVVQTLMTRIAGNENKRADDEFTNIKLMKDTTAAELLKVMDYFGKSLSVGCTYCHVGGGKWDEDTKEEKNTARVMIEMVNMINTSGLSKLPPNRSGRTPTISCVTCHRGRTGPGTALLP